MFVPRLAVRFAIAMVAAVFVAQVSTLAAQEPAPKAETAFSNKDVMKLSKLDLGDEVIVAKIKQAASVDFDLTTDGLVQLKQAGVSKNVIAAMLDRTTAKTAPVVEFPGVAQGRPADLYGEDIRILVNNAEVRLPGSRGDLSTTGMWPVVFTFLDYPGLHARVRTTNLRPPLVVRSEHDPRNYYYLGKLDVNDDEDNNRSLKIEQKMSGFTETTRVVPAGRWYVDYEAAERTAGYWVLTPKRDLEPGEYGVVVPGGILYEFGVD